MENRQPSPGEATPSTPRGVRNGKTSASRTRFRSPYAVAVWWLWLLFAAGNLIDLAVRGRDQLSLVAAAILLLVTGVVFVTAQRPRLVADEDALEIVNPLRAHRVGWAAVTAIEATELVRVRCTWPGGPDGTQKRVIYCWALHSSRRRQISAELRAQLLARRGGARGFGDAARQNPPAVAPDAEKVVAELTERAEQARAAAPDAPATAPESAWYWPGIAAIAVPALALLVVAML